MNNTTEPVATAATDNSPVRLSKRVAAQFACSRSEAEHYIAGGWVRVDGNVVDAPMEKVRPDQRVTLAADASLTPFSATTLIYHKPAGAVFASDEAHSDAAAVLREITADRRSPLCHLKEPLLRRHLAGLKLPCPLAVSASGLVVLSQDFRIIRKLTDRAAPVEHELIVECAESRDGLPAELLGQLGRAPAKAGAACKVSWQNETHLRFAVKGTTSDEIAARCAEAGLHLRALRRLRIGRLSLSGLAVGQWRFLNAGEKF